MITHSKPESSIGFICHPIHYSIFLIGCFDLHFRITILSHVCLFIRNDCTRFGWFLVYCCELLERIKGLLWHVNKYCQQTYSGSFKEIVLCCTHTHTHTASARSKWGRWKFASCQALSCLLAARDCLSLSFSETRIYSQTHTETLKYLVYLDLCGRHSQT